MYVSGLGKVDNMCLSGPLKRLAYSRTGSTFSAAASVSSQGNMGDSEPPDILHETCACIIHTINLQLHVHYN